MTDLLDLLVSLNPWWSGKSFETGKRRESYFSKITKYLDSDEIIILSGVRRSGKTTLLYQIIDYLINSRGVNPRGILFVNCDEPGISRLEQPLDRIFDTYRREIHSEENAVLILDEIQNVPEWERWIKSLHDRKNYRIIISGLSSYLLDSNISTLLSGRYLPVPVFPLDFSEYLLFHEMKIDTDPVHLASRKYEIIGRLKDYLREGGFPDVVLQKDDMVKQDLLKAYYDSIVYRDIVRVNDVRNQKALADLLHYLLTNIASPYSYRRLRETMGINFDSIRDYIHYAEMAKILFEVQFFTYSLHARARANKKIYCIDNGLRNARSFRFSKDEGKLAENLVYVELKRRGEEIYYWKNKGEVDFVVKNADDSLSAINVCYTDSIPGREIRGLQEFGDTFGIAIKERIILTKDTEKVEAGIVYVPLWKWLLITT